MLVSMTGYGSAEAILGEGYSLQVVIKSLNGKHLDCSLRFSLPFPSQEAQVRQMVEKALLRGKITVNAKIEHKETPAEEKAMDKARLSAYYKQLRTLYTSCFIRQENIPSDDAKALFFRALGMIEKSKNTGAKTPSPPSKALWIRTVQEALDGCVMMRKTEGKKTYEDIQRRLKSLFVLIDKVVARAGARDKGLETNMRVRAKQWIGGAGEGSDKGRFQEELFYYLERMSFSEELSRIQSHLSFFKDAIQQPAQGRRLMFIIQEIAREANTLGVKSNDAPIQQLVVDIKMELECMKEQLYNIL